MLRFHTQTAGVQLTAQQPEVNLARVTVQALAAVLGGTQSLHTNAYDEAIALPTEKAARLALRTQQVLAYETDLTATVDPFAGSYAVESMTSDIEEAADALMARVEDLGGAVAAIERGFQKAEIERSAYRDRAGDRRRGARDRRGQQVHPGRRGGLSAAAGRPGHRAGRRRSGWPRCAPAGTRRVHAPDRRPQRAAAGSGSTTENLLYPLREALRARATVGEVCDALRDVWGTVPAARCLLTRDGPRAGMHVTRSPSIASASCTG